MVTQHYSAAAERIRETFFSDGRAGAVLVSRTQLVDGIVRSLWPPPDGVAVFAVGGYGRGELFPFSDIDLLILVASEAARESIREPIAPFLRSLWDEGLRVSQSVHTVAECHELDRNNVELAISLLDRRFLMGDPAVAARLNPRNRAELIQALIGLTRERHAKFQNTIHHLEPHLKDAPGGIRDLHVVRWLVQLTARDAELATVDFETLFQFRCYLHYLTGRDHNILTFELQDQIAELQGRSAAQVMRDYFRQAGSIARNCGQLLRINEAPTSGLFAQFRDRRSRVSNADFTVSREQIFFRVPHQAQHDPELIVRLFVFIARHGLALAPGTERRLAESVVVFNRMLWPVLHEICALPHAGQALRAMHETGVLRSIFPELREIDSLVIRDFYHRYTVDEHTMVAIEGLLKLRDSEQVPFAELAKELPDIAVLIMALIFHDVGKADENESHVISSARIADAALERIGMPQRERQAACELIRLHLEMSTIMNSRDLTEPATAQYLAEKVRTVEQLKYLTLLTWSDISAVNPAAMTQWRAGLLWQLYTVTYRELTRELEAQRIKTSFSDLPHRRRFLDGLPTRYLRTHSEAEVDLHARMQTKSREEGIAVALQYSGSIYTLTILMPDRPALLADVAGALSSFGLNILKAEVFSNRHLTAVNTFVFADPLRTLELNPEERERLQAVVRQAAMREVDVSHLLRGRLRRPAGKRRLTPQVSVDNQVSENATLLQITSEDRPGLLYELAAAIARQECNIEVVLIDTEALKAIDVFYVTHKRLKLADEYAFRLASVLKEVCQY